MSENSHSATVSSMTLSGMRSLEDQVWQRVLNRFTPRVSVWLARGGVAVEDVPDQVQEVWRSVLVSLRHFQRHNHGDSFGGWLHTITQRRTIDYLQRSMQDKAIISLMIDEASRQSVNPEDDSVQIQSIRVNQLTIACQKVKEIVHHSTWQAFEMYVIEEKPVEEVVAALNIPEHNVYTAKSRVLRRLRAMMAEIEANPHEPRT